MRGNSKANLIASIVFCLALFMPLLGMVVPSLNYSPEIRELRSLYKLPQFSIKNISVLPDQYESFFNDHFGFRNWLIQLNNQFMLDCLGVSGSEKVLNGKEGWLYYTGDRAIDDYRGVNQLTIEDLENWQTVLEKKQRWLASRGIDYLFLVAPNKASIYPEHLPDGYVRVKKYSPIDQLLAHLQQNTNIQVLDLREPLKTQKEMGLLFHRRGTHWTSLGAFLAYENISKDLAKKFPQITPITKDDLSKKIQLEEDYGLARMLGLQNKLREKVPRFRLADPKAEYIGKGGSFLIMGNPDSQLPRAVVFRDSFGKALIPYLSESFNYVIYILSRWDRNTLMEDILLDIKPDIVIEQLVERSIKDIDALTIGPEL